MTQSYKTLKHGGYEGADGEYYETIWEAEHGVHARAYNPNVEPVMVGGHKMWKGANGKHYFTKGEAIRQTVVTPYSPAVLEGYTAYMTDEEIYARAMAGNLHAYRI